MPGQPLSHVFEAKIVELGGEDWVFEKIAGGLTMRAIAEQIGCSREWLHNTWLKKGDRKVRYKQAQKDAAPLVFEDGGQILDDVAKKPALMPADVQIARARSDFYVKRASILDPESFGEKQQGINVTFNVGEMHLSALQKLGSMSTPTLLANPAPTLDGVVEPDSDEDAA